MDPGVARQVVDFVHDVLRFPSRRVWARQSRCSACGTSLTMPPRTTERSVTVTLPDRPVFTITLALSASRCSGCGVDNILDRHGVERSVLSALEAGAIDPPGALGEV